ncbi:MAG: hypothetical protein QXM93_06150 [Candidatus Methanomethyliaceae archaeon]
MVNSKNAGNELRLSLRVYKEHLKNSRSNSRIVTIFITLDFNFFASSHRLLVQSLNILTREVFSDLIELKFSSQPFSNITIAPLPESCIHLLLGCLLFVTSEHSPEPPKIANTRTMSPKPVVSATNDYC